jgi:DNA repair protein RecO (recombination protein O)
MLRERTEGVVLRGVEFGETSRIVTLITPDRGRLACIAKGARRKNSTLAPILDTFNRVELVYYWKDGRSVQNLGEASLLDGFGSVKRDLEKSVYAAFPLELALHVAHEDEPSQVLYHVLVHGMEHLGGWHGDVRAHACWQVMRLLSAAGFAPSLDACGLCGSPLSDPTAFVYAGGAACRACRSDRRMSTEEWLALRALAASPETCPVIPCSGTVYTLLRHYAAHQIEADFRSARVIEEMFRQ